MHGQELIDDYSESLYKHHQPPSKIAHSSTIYELGGNSALTRSLSDLFDANFVSVRYFGMEWRELVNKREDASSSSLDICWKLCG